MKLLLVNKNPVVARMMLMSVPKAGFEIEECDNVYELPSGMYEVVVLDDEMYDENFLHDIKQNIKYYQLGLITSSKEIDTKEFDFVLSKPFLPTDLIEILRDVKEKIESQKRSAPLFEEEPKEPFEQFLSEEPKEERIVEVEEHKEESPFVTEELEKSGVLDSEEIKEVSTLLEEEPTPSLKEPEPLAQEPEPLAALQEPHDFPPPPEKREEPSLESFEPSLAQEPPQEPSSLESSSTPESILTESLEERELPIEEAKKERLLDDLVEAKEEPKPAPQEPQSQKMEIDLSGMGIEGLRKLFNGMRLDITVTISFPDEKNV